TAWISRSTGPSGISKNWRKKGSLKSGFCSIATRPLMAMLTTAGATLRTSGASVGGDSDWAPAGVDCVQAEAEKVNKAASRTANRRMVFLPSGRADVGSGRMVAAALDEIVAGAVA